MDSRKLRMARLPGLLLAAMLLLTLASLPASGESQYQLVVFQEGGVYQVGDTVRFEIHFFDRENYVDAAEINLSAGYPWNDDWYIEVDEAAARKAPGIYEISFVLEEEHAPYGFLSLDITAYAVAGSDNPDDRAQGNVWLMIMDDEVTTDFDIEVEADPLEPRPGDTVTFTVSFYNFSTLVDPPEEDIEAELEVFEEEEAVNLTRQSTGVYTYSYTVPADQQQGGLIELDVSAEYDSDYDSGSAYAQLRFYEAWIRVQEFTATAFRGSLYLSDMDGSAVAGVDTKFRYIYDDGADWKERWSNGTTDASGKLDLNLPLPNFDLDDLDIFIEANGTYRDRIDGGLDYPDDDDEAFVPHAPHWEFDVVPQADDRMLERDSDTTIIYRAYNDTLPLPDQEIFVYIVNEDYDFTASGADPAKAVRSVNTTTDATGNFTLAFRTPIACGQFRIIFKTFLPGVAWDGTNYTISYGNPRVSCNHFQEPSIVIQTTNFGIGQRATITATKAVSDEAQAFIEVVPVGDRTSFDPEEDIVVLEWQRLSGGFFGPGTLQEFSGNRVAVEFLLPEFLPAENYLVMVLVLTEEGETYMNYVILDSTGIQVTPTRPPDPDPDFVLKELTWEPYNVEAGTTVTLRATVANTVPGSGDHTVPVAFYVDETSLALETATFSGEGEVVVEATWTAEAGNHQFRVVVDPGEVFDEQDETNNQASQSVTFSSPRVDDDDGFLPGPGLLLAGVALMAVAARRRRRR